MPTALLAIAKSFFSLVLLTGIAFTLMTRQTSLVESAKYCYYELGYQYVDLRVRLQEVEHELTNVRYTIENLEPGPVSAQYTEWDAPLLMAQSAADDWHRLTCQTESLLLQTAYAANRLPHLQDAILLWDNEKLACE